MSKAVSIKKEIRSLVEEYYKEVFAPQIFDPGKSHVPVSGKVFDDIDIYNIVESALDGWFTTGRFNTAFEKRLAKYVGVKHVLTVNSGSSANLLAVATLTAQELGDEAVKPGDEVITVAASFPTTVNPWTLYGAVPVFVDVDIPTYNIDVSRIEAAITPKTKAIMVAHTMGNPFDAAAVAAICKKHNLWMVEDCCDALGATIHGKHVGTYGDIGTFSFYPAHHITMGEGGAVFTSDSKLKKITESFRDWGRDCWCASGKDNTCGKRFEWELGALPYGYDHKYIYSRLGYNLKITDMQAALGLSQLDKLDGFVAQRKHNYHRLKTGLNDLQHKLILPEATPHSEPSWFGFLITIKPDAGITRNELIAELSKQNIGTRLLFSGDLRKQPYFTSYTYREVGTFENTELILSNTFWIGVTPMITDEMVNHIITTFKKIFS
ncbi:MAG: lipopolysaccharide biosynthesis protein RfbH [Bacteroidota bacterium]